MKKFVALFAVLFVLAFSASASTIWSQDWDSTPAFSGTYDTLSIEMSVGGGEFSQALGAFSTGNPWTTGFDPYLVTATSATDLQGTPGTDNIWTIYFASALNVGFDIQFKYYDGGLGGEVKKTETWRYLGTGTGNNPVSSWRQVENSDFTGVPEPTTVFLTGVGLLALGFVSRRHRAR